MTPCPVCPPGEGCSCLAQWGYVPAWGELDAASHAAARLLRVARNGPPPGSRFGWAPIHPVHPVRVIRVDPDDAYHGMAIGNRIYIFPTSPVEDATTLVHEVAHVVIGASVPHEREHGSTFRGVYMDLIQHITGRCPQGDVHHLDAFLRTYFCSNPNHPLLELFPCP